MAMKTLDAEGFEPSFKTTYEKNEAKKKKKKKGSLFQATPFQKELLKKEGSPAQQIGAIAGTMLGNILRRKKLKNEKSGE